MGHADRKFVRYCQMDKKSISKLTRYRYILGNNNGAPIDYGGNIRKRAKRITDILDNNDKLKTSRAKAQGYAMQFESKSSAKKKQTSQKTNTTKSAATAPSK